MKTTLLLIVMCAIAGSGFNAIAQDAKASIYDFKMKSIDGKEIPLSTYKGKYILIVNVASKCGNTPQYSDLQKMHETYGSELAILGFPANNFAGQEPGTNMEIAQFCSENYGVTFQMFEKISVKGEDRHPLYAFLEAKTGQVPDWNFAKYLIDKEGNVVTFFNAKTKPLDEKIIAKLK